MASSDTNSKPATGDEFVVVGEPRFNNRNRSFDLVEFEGRTCIRFKYPGDRPYRPEILEAARLIRDHPCAHIAGVHDVGERRIIGQYLTGGEPLGKIGVISDEKASWNISARRRGRVGRRNLRPQLRDVRDHFDAFLEQMKHVARHMRRIGLWHGDLVPQNVLWSVEKKHLWLVDIAGFLPRSFLEGRPELIYERGRRERGVIDPDDYSVDADYLRRRFLQDLAPWPVLVARKLSLLEPI